MDEALVEVTLVELDKKSAPCGSCLGVGMVVAEECGDAVLDNVAAPSSDLAVLAEVGAGQPHAVRRDSEAVVEDCLWLPTFCSSHWLDQEGQESVPQDQARNLEDPIERRADLPHSRLDSAAGVCPVAQEHYVGWASQ